MNINDLPEVYPGLYSIPLLTVRPYLLPTGVSGSDRWSECRSRDEGMDDFQQVLGKRGENFHDCVIKSVVGYRSGSMSFLFITLRFKYGLAQAKVFFDNTEVEIRSSGSKSSL